MSGPKRNPDKLNTIGVVVVGICGAVMVYVSIAALLVCDPVLVLSSCARLLHSSLARPSKPFTPPLSGCLRNAAPLLPFCLCSSLLL